MAKRSRRRTSARGASAIRKSLNEAQRAVGGYVRSGSKQVNDAVSTFLSKFDTAHLLDALRKRTAGGRGMGSARRSTGRRSSARRSISARKRRSIPKVRRAAARKKTATRRSVRRK